MRDKSKLSAEQSKLEKTFLEKGFDLFSSRSIESVSMQDVADASGHGIATLYRHFTTKAGFVVAMAEWQWAEFLKENRRRRPRADFEGMTAAEMFSFHLDSFLELYRKNKALLRFTQFLNIYVQAEHIDPGTIESYRELIVPVAAFFHEMYERAKRDHTLRTDSSEQEMLSITLHLMLAAVTRYAVGLMYQPEEGFDAEKELETQREFLYSKYASL